MNQSPMLCPQCRYGLPYTRQQLATRRQVSCPSCNAVLKVTPTDPVVQLIATSDPAVVMPVTSARPRIM